MATTTKYDPQNDTPNELREHIQAIAIASGDWRLSSRRELPFLATQLLPGEGLLQMCLGVAGSGTWLVSLTDRRVIMITSSGGNSSQTVVASFDRIRGIFGSKGIFLGEIWIKCETPHGIFERTFKNIMPKQAALKFAGAVRTATESHATKDGTEVPLHKLAANITHARRDNGIDMSHASTAMKQTNLGGNIAAWVIACGLTVGGAYLLLFFIIPFAFDILTGSLSERWQVKSQYAETWTALDDEGQRAFLRMDDSMRAKVASLPIAEQGEKVLDWWLVEKKSCPYGENPRVDGYKVCRSKRENDLGNWALDQFLEQKK
ncbi:hypothetical protein FJW07_21910 [Mesorhizobium sp. B3-1-9]|uniref:PH domain-containing protein n=1 Tax=Mesorhizobium sp. B3-1-9 TaxID=2589892 RepID=UPI0011274D1F|nr:PH domain-containing protein [Mesorhizobium sp. B3-1-9]TPI36301.1 hypothetical protein FJW07_21910 [Mesorhizobium sp. B3-1-9]